MEQGWLGMAFPTLGSQDLNKIYDAALSTEPIVLHTHEENRYFLSKFIFLGMICAVS